MRRIAVSLVLLAAALIAAPRTAAAQFTIRSTESAPAARDSAQKAQFDAVKDDLQALIRAQEAYFKEHGRYAAELGDLPGYALRRGSIVTYTGGPDWYVALGGGFEIGMQQVVVWRERDAAVAQAASPR